MIDLSICIPYYGELDYLRHCLASLHERQPASRFEVVVIDDASPEPCAELLGRLFPSTRVVRNPENLGFAGAVNVGAGLTSGRHLLVLNSDTEILTGVDEMVAFLDAQPEVAAVGPRILNPDHSLQLQCRRGELTPISALGYATRLDRRFPRGRLGRYLERWRSELEVQDVPALSGACMMVRREAFEEHSGFDREFVMYGEDLDLCYRLGEDGWRVVYFPAAEVIHAGGRGGTARCFLRSSLHYHRALWLIFRRHAGLRAGSFAGVSIGAALMLAFLGSCAVGFLGNRRVGTRKPGVEIDPAAWSASSATLDSSGKLTGPRPGRLTGS